jgi:hypothetical protein
MPFLRISLRPAALLAAMIASPGCTPKLPPVVPASGTLYLDGKPLPFATIEFVPTLDDFGASSNSTALTDEHGRFTLVCNHLQQPGAVVATHKVIVNEYTPDDMRGPGQKAQQQYAEYSAKLKNRPIPPQYALISRTPVTVEVKAGQNTYDIYLTRQ